MCRFDAQEQQREVPTVGLRQYGFQTLTMICKSLTYKKLELEEVQALANALMHKNNKVKHLELIVGIYCNPENWSAPPHLDSCGLGIEEVKVLAEALKHENNKVTNL